MSLALFDVVAELEKDIAGASHVLVCLTVDKLMSRDKEPHSLDTSVEQSFRSLVSNPRVSLAVVSGRSRNDLHRQLPIPGLIYVGNHGLEISGDGFIFVESNALSYTGALADLAEKLKQKLGTVPGVHFEERGLTLGIHYQDAPPGKGEEIRGQVHNILAATNHPFHLTAGDKSFEVHPRVPWNQAKATAWIKERLGQPEALVVYVSDDVADEETFAALPEAITIKVGRGPETAARYRVDDHSELWRFLQVLEMSLGA